MQMYIDTHLTTFIVSFTVILTTIFYIFKRYKDKSYKILQLQEIIGSTTPVTKTDLRGKITYANKAFVALSGYSSEELMGNFHSMVRDAASDAKVFDNLWNTIKAKKTWKGIITNVTKGGNKYTVDVTIIPILDTYGEITEYIAIRHNITEFDNINTMLKDELFESNQIIMKNTTYNIQYQEAIESSAYILKTDIDNIITFANDNFIELSGYELEELMGMNCQQLRDEKHIKNGDCSNIQDKLSRNETVSIVFANIAKSGTYYYVDTIVYPMSDIHGNVEEHLHIMHDITKISELHDEIIETQKEIIFQMGAMGESRSKETANHVRRVAEYSKLLAELYGLSEHDSELLQLASPMHDIGKVGISDAILLKNGKLTGDEFEIMKTHAKLGYDMLKYSNRPILQAAAIVANEHHEKYNGSGYPNGTQGNDIHIYGRITAVADVFDALGSKRTYKKAWDLERILTLLKEERGKHFDPNLVDLFIKNIQKFVIIRDRFQD